MASVKLDNVRKVYEGGVTAVDNVTIDIADKEFVVLVGPSGCGKSTTLRMVAGLEEISSGSISIDSRIVNDIPPKDRDIAMVFQNYALYPHMTVYENMAFGLKLRKYSKQEIEKRVEEAAQILSIKELLNRKPKALSGGQRQRVAVGRAIVRKPKVFLFDEPLSNLDAKLRVQMRTEISKLHQKLGATMIYVTHDQTEAMTMGDRIVVMKEGKVQQINTPLNLYHHPANKFVAGFIGSPAMNFLTGMIAGDGALVFQEKKTSLRFKLTADQSKKLKKMAGKEIWMGIRPEHIHECEGRSTSKSRIDAMVEVVEPMGNEVYLYFTIAEGCQFISRMPAVRELKAGSTMKFEFDMSHAHFFDQETEMVF